MGFIGEKIVKRLDLEPIPDNVPAPEIVPEPAPAEPVPSQEVPA